MRNRNHRALGHLIPEDLLDAKGRFQINGRRCLFEERHLC